MKIVICDDEKIFVDKTYDIVKKYCEDDEISCYEDAEQLLNDIENSTYNNDIYILDIEIDNINGLDIAKKIREKDTSALIIFLTNYDKYVYDADNKVYKRYVNGKEHVDDVTKKQYTFKNIITYQVANSTIKGDNKGRQEINNIGTGTGYYISNGVAVKINWEKKDRSSKTVYTYEDGTTLKVNDGNTFIQIQPKNQTLKIEG